ncbi:MAG: hypothetical protein R3350_08755, partial [Saprospiraceae bacterium]|nr:hypothetical protein [Saprospiraceae bacterium]
MKKYFLLIPAIIFLAATCKNTPAGQDACIDESQIDPGRICYELYQPVCGCNGETYPNDCYAER